MGILRVGRFRGQWMLDGIELRNGETVELCARFAVDGAGRPIEAWIRGCFRNEHGAAWFAVTVDGVPDHTTLLMPLGRDGSATGEITRALLRRPRS